MPITERTLRKWRVEALQLDKWARDMPWKVKKLRQQYLKQYPYVNVSCECLLNC